MAKGEPRWGKANNQTPAYQQARDDMVTRMSKLREERDRKLATSAKILAKPKRK